MSRSQQVARLAFELRGRLSGISTEIEEFPTGAIWLDVWVSGRLFTLAYQPSENSFGVDEFDIDDHGIGTHFRFSFDEIEPACEKLVELIGEAIHHIG